MSRSRPWFSLEIEGTRAKCPVGEAVGNLNSTQGKIPVLSCEGGSIRGEIARLAANLVANVEPYRRACHGELFSVPDSATASWAKNARMVVLIDGCSLRCHGRIAETLVGSDRLIQFDAQAHHKKFTDVFGIDDVPESERKDAAREVAYWVLDSLKREPRVSPTNVSARADMPVSPEPSLHVCALCGGELTTGSYLSLQQQGTDPLLWSCRDCQNKLARGIDDESLIGG